VRDISPQSIAWRDQFASSNMVNHNIKLPKIKSGEVCSDRCKKKAIACGRDPPSASVLVPISLEVSQERLRSVNCSFAHPMERVKGERSECVALKALEARVSGVLGFARRFSGFCRYQTI